MRCEAVFATGQRPAPVGSPCPPALLLADEHSGRMPRLPAFLLNYTHHAAHSHYKPPARHGPWVPVAQEPGPMPDVSAQFGQGTVLAGGSC